MKRLALAFFLFAAPATAWAQYAGTAFVVSSCGAQSFTVGQRQVFTMDTSGNLCSSTAGGAASTVSVTSWGGGTLGAMANYGTSPGAVLVPGVNAFITNSPSVNISQINGQTAANGGATGSLLVEQGCAGQSVANTTVKAINNAASSSNLKLVSKVSAQNVYICAINLVVAVATNVALVNGTKVTNECDTSTAGMAGGATAATGWSFAANDGLTQGNGQGVIFKTTSTNFDVCLLFSAANQVSGSITYAQF